MPTKGTEREVEVEGRTLKLSNLDKQLYPSGFTKGEFIDYLARIAPVLLPHLRDRPLTLRRFPEGVDGESFFEKRCPRHAPDWIRKEEVGAASTDPITFCVCDDLPTLIWLGQLATLEMHPYLAPATDPLSPTVLAVDLDPGPPATAVDCAQVALILREVFEGLGLQSFPKSSGSKGIQLYLPLNPGSSFEQTKPFARALARLLEQRHPKLIVSKMSKELRKGKVFIDWSQNDPAKTTVAPYSLRAKQRPTVSTPLTWEEVEALDGDGEPDDVLFEPAQVLERVDRDGDLFGAVLELEQTLPEL